MNKEGESSSSSTIPVDDCIANGSISIKLPNLEALNDINGKAQQIASKVEEIGGLTWQMKIRRVLKPDGLNLFIYCNEGVEDHLWMCKVQFKVVCWTVNRPPFHSSNYGHFHGFNSHSWFFPIRIFPRYKLEMEQSPFEIRLEIKLCQMQEKSLPTLDTSLLVNMGEGRSETLLVNKTALANLSSYFRNLFVGDWSDKKKQEGNMFELYETENLDIRAFKAMLYSAMTLGEMVPESNFLDYELSTELVEQATKYDFPMLLNYCEKFLIEARNRPYSALELLEFADRFNLDKLKEHCLKRISTSDFFYYYNPRSYGEKKREEIKKNKQILSRLGKATREELLAELDGEKVGQGHLQTLKQAEQLNLAKLMEHCLENVHLGDLLNYGNRNIFSELSEATKKRIQAKLDEKIDLNASPHAKMELLDVADRFGLVLLKEHCLEQISVSDFVQKKGVYNKNRGMISSLNKATRDELTAKLNEKLDFKECPHSKMALLEVADQLKLVQLKQHCLDELNVLDYLVDSSEYKELHNGLSKATQEQLQAKLDGKLDLNDCLHSKMALLEVADRLKLVQLKQHCLDGMNVSDFMKNIGRNMEIHARLSKATQEQLQAKLDGKAEELRGLTEQLKSGVEANKTKRVLVEQFNKLAESVLGKEQSEEKK